MCKFACLRASVALLLLSADANAGVQGCEFSDRPDDGIGCPMRDGPGPGQPMGGGFFAGPSEGAPLASLDSRGRTELKQWAAIEGATLVLDASPAEDGALGRAAELEDARLITPNPGAHFERVAVDATG